MRRLLPLLALILLAACASPTPPPPTLMISTSTPAPTPTPEDDTVTVTSELPGWVEGHIDAETAEGRTVRVNVLLSLPPNFDPTATAAYPLEIHLPHGGTVGAGKGALQALGRPFTLTQNISDYPFIVAYAQLPGDGITWYELADAVIAYKGWVTATYPVDPDRIYLTGYSNGGRGAFEVGSQYAEEFAAVAIYAGYTERLQSELCGFGTTPVHLYHGANDLTIPLEESQAAYDTLTECGGNVTLTVLESAGHFDLYPRLLMDTTVYDWLLGHSL